MQARTKAARALDRALGAAALWAAGFFYFAARVKSPALSAMLSLLVTGGLLYALYLFRRRASGRQAAKREREARQRAALYALTMLPEQTALYRATEALRQAYGLAHVETRARLRILRDGQGRRIAAGLCQSPQAADVAAAHAFHRERGKKPGVLLCAGGATKEALRYAEGLRPPLRLIDLAALPLPEAPADIVPPAEDARERIPWRRLLPDERSAPRCLPPALGLMTAYIFTGALSCLFAALLLLFLALAGRGRDGETPRLF